MTLFSYFMVYLICTTYIGFFFVRITHYVFIYQNPVEIIKGCSTGAGVAAVLLIIVGVIIKNIVNDFESSIRKKNFSAAEKNYKRFNAPLTCAYLIGFIVGPTVTNIAEGINGKITFDPVILFIMLLQGFAVALLCYTVTIYKVKYVRMADMMKKAGMKNVNTNMNGILHICIFGCVFFSIMNFVIVPIGLLNNPIPNPLTRFLIYSIIAAVLNDSICIICYRMIVSAIQHKEKSVKVKLFEETKSIASSAGESAAIGQDQNADIKEVVATIEDYDSMISSIEEKINNVNNLAETTKKDVDDGIKYLEDNEKNLHEILEANIKTIEEIKDLVYGIENISEIVNLINEIADDAKIIAFNAELEASAAGTSGRNFHIVASEVRRLSDSIIDSTYDIRTRIEMVKESSTKLILESERESKKVRNGYDNAKILGGKFESIRTSSDQTAFSSCDIKKFINQMTVSSQQLLTAMKQIAYGVENFSQSTDRIRCYSEELEHMAEEI